MRVSLGSVRAALAGGSGPVDIVRSTYRRIGSSTSEHAWIALRPEAEVLADAERVARTVDPAAPLYGVPFAVKDNIDVAGMPTTAGCPAYAYRPDRSAPVVDRLLGAGALLVGKTNMDQFATGLVGTRSPYGACRSVLDPAAISGGSSSGSAVVVAAGLVPFALGTDTAGSGRVPAACNGIVGLKPTRGRVSTTGVVPACRSLDCVSVLATSVVDAAEVLSVVEGWDRGDLSSRRAPPELDRGPRGWGIANAAALALCDAATASGFADAASVWAANGVEIEEVDLEPFLAAGRLLYEGAFVAERYAAVGPFVDEHRDEVDPTVGAVIAAAGALKAADLFADQHRLAHLARSTEDVWERCDVVVLPTVPRIPTVEEALANPTGVNSELGTFTNFVNLLDLCAVAVPAGDLGDRLSLGVTVLAPAWAEHRALEAALSVHSCERRTS